MGIKDWLTTQRGQTLRDKAADAVKGKAADAVDKVNPAAAARRARQNRALAKGKKLCLGCGNPCPKGGNVHKRCAGLVAGSYKSIMDVEG
jgi:hypothetical protein